MILPFSKTKKAYWNLFVNLDRINWAIDETNIQHFVQELRSLYPLLEKYEMRMPAIDPVRIGGKQYDNTWYEFHLTFLKALRRSVRNKTFDLTQWNNDVVRENEKRNTHVWRQAAPAAKTRVTEAEALFMLRSSSLVRRRLKPETITVLDAIASKLGHYKTRTDVEADELSRHLLREFSGSLPQAVFDNQYGKEPLSWWIDKEADRCAGT